jgi:hypothetical protein
MRFRFSARLAALLVAPAAWGDGLPGQRDAFPPNAPPMPVCNAPREGVAACLAGRQCVCRLEPGGSVAGRPAGYRWDCGALRPACAEPPADLPRSEMPAALYPQVTLPELAPSQDRLRRDGLRR